MNVAAVQFKADKTDPAGSRRRLVALAERAAEGRDLVVLPEMAATGYLFADRAAVAAVAEAPDGPTGTALARVAAAAGTFLVAGFAERDGDRLYNAAMVLDRAGRLVAVYRKTLLYEADEHWATPGDRPYATYDTGRGTFGVGICMDLNDDRFVAWLAEAAPRALAFPTNWVLGEIDVWAYWAWRLRGTSVALVAANTWGRESAAGAARSADRDRSRGAPLPGATESAAEEVEDSAAGSLVRETTFTGRSLVLEGRVARAWLPDTGDGVARATLGRSSAAARPKGSGPPNG